MGDQDALFYFLGDLCGWAKMELERRWVQALVSIFAVARSLIEFKSLEWAEKED